MGLIHWSHQRVLTAVVLALVLFLAGCGVHSAAPPDPMPVVTIPQVALPTPNAFDYDVKAGTALVDRDKIEDALSATRSLTYTLAQKEELVRENAQVLRLVRAGFAFPFVSDESRTGNAAIRNYSKIRRIARLLKLEGKVEEAKGDWGAAVGSDLDIVRLGEDLPHGASESGWLDSLLCQGSGQRPLWALIPRLTAPQARAAARRLEAIEAHHTPFVLVMQQEEWSGQASLLVRLAKPNWRQAMLDNELSGVINGSSENTLRAILWTALRRSTRRSLFDTYTRYREEFVRSARAPYAAHVPIKRVPLDPDDMLGFFVFKMDPYKSGQFRDAGSQAQNALLLTALALRAYLLEHRKAPTTLDALVPGYLSKVPRDPFALSGPLHYRPAGVQYVLYSIGPDGRDDHGTAIYDPAKPAPVRAGSIDQRYVVMETSKGDIVAGVNLF
jgi:hypothetical protein